MLLLPISIRFYFRNPFHVENQYYVIAPNQCGVGANQAPTYGHSLAVDPFGTLLCEGSENQPETLNVSLSKLLINRTRQHFPLLKARKLNKR